MLKRFLPALILAIALLIRGGVADAHAVVTNTAPADGSVIEKSPPVVMIQFNEPVEAEFSPLVVRNAAGKRVDGGDAWIDKMKRNLAVVSVPPVPDGFYTATYRVTSLDGHAVQGVIGFTVGKGAAPGTAPSAPAATGVPAGTSAAHGAMLLLATLLAGLCWFLALVWRPVAGKGNAPAVARVALILTGLFFIAAVAELSLHAVAASGEPLSAGLLGQALKARTGRVWLVRVALALVTGLTLAGTKYWWDGPAWVPAQLPGAALLASLSMQSHAAATQETLPVVADWIHLVGASAWAGGLLGFAAVLLPALAGKSSEEREQALAQAVPRFSGIAVLAVAAIAGSGLYGALLHIPSWQTLYTTVSGRFLLAKLILLLPLLALGAYNYGREGKGSFKRAVLAELLLMLGVFAATGFLTTLPPAKVEIAARGTSFADSFVQDGLEIGLQINSLRPGVTYPVITVKKGGVPAQGANVGLRVTMVEHDMGEQNVDAREESPGSYKSEQMIIGMEGTLHVEVVILTKEGKEVRHLFPVVVPPVVAP